MALHFKHFVLLGLSLLPFGLSTLAAFAAWEGFEGLASLPKLAAVVGCWIIVFALGTRAFWKVVEVMSPRT